jgi:malate dehydrogenase (oxaloacetate-decarboxylating)
MKREFAERTNPRAVAGGIADALEGTDVLIGVSSTKVPEEDIACTAEGAIVFALSNPDPQVAPASRAATPRPSRPDAAPSRTDRQRARVPGHLPRRARRGRPPHHTRKEAAAAQAIAGLAEDKLRRTTLS